jgi:hypothetical protein
MDTGSLIKKSKIGLILYPNTVTVGSMTDWWISAPRDQAWWQSWFDRYATFLINYAEFANLIDARALVIGGPDVLPALPGGLLPDGSPSGVPDYAKQRWPELIADIRGRFRGSVYWASNYSGMQALPEFATTLDGIYLLWSPSLVSTPESASRPLSDEIGWLLDEGVAPVQKQINKPVILAVNYGSYDGAADGCDSVPTRCLPFDPVTGTHPDSADLQLNLQAQVDLYNAALNAVNQREWIGGFISRNYFPPVILKDTSASIQGKPAWDVVWYWYPQLLGKEPAGN